MGRKKVSDANAGIDMEAHMIAVRGRCSVRATGTASIRVMISGGYDQGCRTRAVGRGLKDEGCRTRAVDGAVGC